MSPLVISQSALSLFKTCRKAYQIGYEMNLEPMTTSDAVENGTAIHKYLEYAAVGKADGVDWDTDLGRVAKAYLDYKPLPDAPMLIGKEDPYFVELLPEVYVRCTYDLVYRMGNEIVIRDYKTFQKAPTLDLDLDFQSRFYIASAMRHFKTHKVTFEFEYIRQELGRELKSGYVPWPQEDLYMNYPLVITSREADQVWKEAQWIARDLLRAKQENAWYHQDRKGFGGCQSCFYKHLCKAENQLGVLDEQTIRLLATKREPIHALRAD